jgi:hypothetical protein
VNEQPTNAQRASIMNFQFLLSTQTRRPRATRALHFSRSRISRHTLHFNDADEVSCRAGAIKCSRCRASFAPIRAVFAHGIWFPRWIWLLAGPFSETKNWRNHLIESIHSQARGSLEKRTCQ